MTNTFFLITTIILFIISVLYFVLEKTIKNSLKKLYSTKQYKVTNENAKIALEYISSWTTWLTGLQTATIASMGIISKSHLLSNMQKTFGYFSLIFFAFSIIFSTFLLCSVPSIQQRLKIKPSLKNDIYNKDLFTGIGISLQHLSGLVHTYFIIGVIFFALFIFSIFS